MSGINCTVCGQALRRADRRCPNCQRVGVLCGRFLVNPLALGEGGFATVFEAADLDAAGARCAVKLVPYKLSERGRVEREVRAMQALGAAGLSCVPQVYAVDDEDPGRYYIVMEYIAGPSLNTLIGAPWPPPDVSAFLDVMLGHLAAIHDAGIIHRDIKPENIKRPAPGVYTLLDFGIAKHITDTQSQRALTMAYAPPEQLGSGRGRTGPRSDLFSLGATAYELLTGKQPPSSSDRLQERDPLLAPSELLGAALPAGLERTVLAMIALSPDDRPPTARAALAMLHEPPPRQPAVTVRLPDRRDPTSGSTFHPLVDVYGRGRVVALATDPAARLIAVGTTLGIWLYDAQSLEERRFIETDGAISGLTLVQSGRAMIATWRNTTRRFALDTARGLRISAEHWGEGTARAVSPDGQRIVVGGADGLALLSLGEPGPPSPLLAPGDSPQQLIFSPGGDLLVAAIRRELRAWGADGAPRWRIGEQPARIGACAISPDGDLIASAAGATIRLHRQSDGRLIREIADLGERVGGLAFSPDGRTLAAAAGARVQCWGMPDGQPLAGPGPQPAPLVGIGFTRGGAALALASEAGVIAWEVAGGDVARTGGEHMGKLYSVGWAGPDALIIAGDATRLLTLRDRKLSLAATLDAPVAQGGGMAIAPGGDPIAIAGAAGVTLWQARAPGRRIDARLAQTNALAFSPDGGALIVLGDRVERHPLAGGGPAPAAPIDIAGAIELALAADGSVCAALLDQGLRAWRTDDGALLADLGRDRLAAIAGGPPLNLALSADGGALALIAAEQVALLDMSQPDAPPAQIAARAQHVAFGPRGDALATVDGGAITIWRRRGAQWADSYQLVGHTDFVSQLAFSPDGGLVASASYDGTLRLWQIAERGP